MLWNRLQPFTTTPAAFPFPRLRQFPRPRLNGILSLGRDVHVESFEEFLLKLQGEITHQMESLDGGNVVFCEDAWERESGKGFGITKVLENGDVLEKGAVNVSIIRGKLTATRAATMKTRGLEIDPSGGQNYSAAALSIVFHSSHPFIPTLRADIRRFSVHGEVWYGGGADLTPSYLFSEDAIEFHHFWKNLCDQYSGELYPVLKEQCDAYFYIPCRKEHRGIGGIFFDDLAPKQTPFDVDAFVEGVGQNIFTSWQPIVHRRRQMPFTKEHRSWQLFRRGRYIEFNLLYDRGIRFGLEGGRIESIMVSAPPVVHWPYNHQPGANSPEQQLVELSFELKHPIFDTGARPLPLICTDVDVCHHEENLIEKGVQHLSTVSDKKRRGVWQHNDMTAFNMCDMNLELHDPFYRSDVFMMFCFKILPCKKSYRHDWRVCPFAHGDETAKRRDPRSFKYTGVICPDAKKGRSCPRGDDCPCTHSLFEYWLHPTRFKTEICSRGSRCNRPFCFFAHKQSEIRKPNFRVQMQGLTCEPMKINMSTALDTISCISPPSYATFQKADTNNLNSTTTTTTTASGSVGGRVHSSNDHCLHQLLSHENFAASSVSTKQPVPTTTTATASSGKSPLSLFDASPLLQSAMSRVSLDGSTSVQDSGSSCDVELPPATRNYLIGGNSSSMSQHSGNGHTVIHSMGGTTETITDHPHSKESSSPTLEPKFNEKQNQLIKNGISIPSLSMPLCPILPQIPTMEQNSVDWYSIPIQDSLRLSARGPSSRSTLHYHDSQRFGTPRLGAVTGISPRFLESHNLSARNLSIQEETMGDGFFTHQQDQHHHMPESGSHSGYDRSFLMATIQDVYQSMLSGSVDTAHTSNNVAPTTTAALGATTVMSHLNKRSNFVLDSHLALSSGNETESLNPMIFQSTPSSSALSGIHHEILTNTTQSMNSGNACCGLEGLQHTTTLSPRGLGPATPGNHYKTFERMISTLLQADSDGTSRYFN